MAICRSRSAARVISLFRTFSPSLLRTILPASHSPQRLQETPPWARARCCYGIPKMTLPASPAGSRCNENENCPRSYVPLSHRIAFSNHDRSRERGTFDPGIQSRGGGPGNAVLVAMESATFFDLYLHTISSGAHLEGTGPGHDCREAARRLG